MGARVCSAGQTIHERCVDWVHKGSLNEKLVGVISNLLGGYTTPINYSRRPLLPPLQICTGVLIWRFGVTCEHLL